MSIRSSLHMTSRNMGQLIDKINTRGIGTLEKNKNNKIQAFSSFIAQTAGLFMDCKRLYRKLNPYNSDISYFPYQRRTTCDIVSSSVLIKDPTLLNFITEIIREYIKVYDYYSKFSKSSDESVKEEVKQKVSFFIEQLILAFREIYREQWKDIYDEIMRLYPMDVFIMMRFHIGKMHDYDTEEHRNAASFLGRLGKVPMARGKNRKIATTRRKSSNRRRTTRKR